jgi:hypothetical protein
LSLLPQNWDAGRDGRGQAFLAQILRQRASDEFVKGVLRDMQWREGSNPCTLAEENDEVSRLPYGCGFPRAVHRSPETLFGFYVPEGCFVTSCAKKRETSAVKPSIFFQANSLPESAQTDGDQIPQRRQMTRCANSRHARQENVWQREPVHIAQRCNRSIVAVLLLTFCSGLNATHRVLTLTVRKS